MLTERHFRIWKRLASVSRIISARQRATATTCPLQTTTITCSTPIAENVLRSEEICTELLQPFDGKCVSPRDAESAKFLRSRELRSRFSNLLSSRSLFTSASGQTVIRTSPERNSTDNSKTNIDLKTKTARRPAATSRRTTSQKV